jgi:hypothetical protein
VLDYNYPPEKVSSDSIEELAGLGEANYVYNFQEASEYLYQTHARSGSGNIGRIGTTGALFQ